MKKILFSVILIATYATSFGQTEWVIDKGHSSIRFSTTHLLISEVVGKFNDFEGSIVSSSDDFNGSTISFSAKTASIDTDNDRRDNHLKSDDFFNAESYPEIIFKGKIVKEGDKYFLDGDFTMRGTTKPIKFDVKYMGQVPTNRGRKAGFRVTGTVNRFDYGLKWDRAVEAGGLVVGEEIEITCSLELREVVAEKEN